MSAVYGDLSSKKIAQRVAGLRNLSESMRRDAGWKASAMFLAEAAWVIEQQQAEIERLQSERTGA